MVHETVQLLQLWKLSFMEGGFLLKAQVHAMEINVSQALGISSGRFNSPLREAQGIKLNWFHAVASEYHFYTFDKYPFLLVFLLTSPGVKVHVFISWTSQGSSSYLKIVVNHYNEFNAYKTQSMVVNLLDKNQYCRGLMYSWIEKKLVTD